MCGENVFEVVDGNAYTGSSPRVRGKLMMKRLFIDYERLIPACAGKTQPLSTQTRQHRAHPRVCGEN